jgi:SAM-dependent methyltransferase
MPRTTPSAQRECSSSAPDRQQTWRAGRVSQTDGVDTNPRERRESFDKVPDIYHQIRPGYPRALFDDLFDLLAERPHVLEVGPGTGQATRDLLARGATVRAIEIGLAMAEQLRQVLPARELTVTIGDFEHVPTDEGSYDCVFSATAYHWIGPRARLDRPAALLKPGGVVAIVDLIQVDSPNDRGFFAAAQPIYARCGEGHTGPPPPRRDEVDPPMRSALLHDGRFAGLEVRRYDWDQTYCAAEYRQLMLSYSGTQSMEPATRQCLLDDMEAFVREQFDDQVTRPLVVTLTTATRSP